MHIRVKRMKTIYFMQCDPRETVLNVKQKLLALSEQPRYKSASGLNVYWRSVKRSPNLYGSKGIIHLTVYANAGGVNNTCLSPKKSYLTNWKPKDNTYLKK